MRILVAEDDLPVAGFLRKSLEAEQYAVDTAADGAEAKYMAESYDYDLVILDVNLPKMTGFEVLDTLKKNPATENIPVIMLTARTQDQDVLRGWQAGVECYLTKPFNPIELVTFIKRIFAVEEQEAAEKRYDL